MEEIREKQSKMPTSTNSQGRKFTKSDTKNLLPKMHNQEIYRIQEHNWAAACKLRNIFYYSPTSGSGTIGGVPREQKASAAS
eukprot:jgi/Tetstr1/435098/TSEL_024066.t1